MTRKQLPRVRSKADFARARYSCATLSVSFTSSPQFFPELQGVRITLSAQSQYNYASFAMVIAIVPQLHTRSSIACFGQPRNVCTARRDGLHAQKHEPFRRRIEVISSCALRGRCCWKGLLLTAATRHGNETSAPLKVDATSRFVFNTLRRLSTPVTAVRCDQVSCTWDFTFNSETWRLQKHDTPAGFCEYAHLTTYVAREKQERPPSDRTHGILFLPVLCVSIMVQAHLVDFPTASKHDLRCSPSHEMQG